MVGVVWGADHNGRKRTLLVGSGCGIVTVAGASEAFLHFGAKSILQEKEGQVLHCPVRGKQLKENPEKFEGILQLNEKWVQTLNKMWRKHKA